MAGLDGEIETFEQDDEPTEIPTAFLVGGLAKIDLHDVVRVSGTSMYPRIEPGDRIIFFQDPAVISNSIVLAESPEHHVYVKTIKRDSATGLIRLESLGDGACFTELKGWRILGHAICIMGRADGTRRNIEWDDGRYLKA